MIIYCGTDNKNEKFRVKDVPITDYGVGWVGSNDADMARKFGRYQYKMRLGSTDGILLNDVGDWKSRYKEQVKSLVGAGDLDRLAKYGKIRVNAVENYIAALTRVSLYKAIQTIRVDLYPDNDYLWVTKVISDLKISGIMLGSSNSLLLFWDPSIISNYVLVEIN